MIFVWPLRVAVATISASLEQNIKHAVYKSVELSGSVIWHTYYAVLQVKRLTFNAVVLRVT